MGDLKLNFGETDLDLKEETEEDASIDTEFKEELQDDPVCIKLESIGNKEQIIKKKPGRKRKEFLVPKLCPHEDCNSTFKVVRNLRRHISSVHQCSMVKCQCCGKFVKDLKRHLRINLCNIPEEERVKRPTEKKVCEICKKVMTKTNIAQHMITKHGHGNPIEFHCGHCNYKTNKKYNLKLHVTRVHDVGDHYKKTCPHCLKEVIDLEFHIKNYHYDAILFEDSEGTLDSGLSIKSN